MVSYGLIQCVVGILGNVLWLSMFLSAMPTFVCIYKKGSVGQYSPMPYLLTFFNCMIWVLYSIPNVHLNSIWILTISSAGCVIEFVYLLLFVIYSSGKRKRLQLISFVVAEILFIVLLATLVLSMVHTTKGRVRIVGTIGLVTSILMYGAPLSIMKMVIKTKSVEYMPLYLSLTSFFNAAAWTLYGLLPFDPYVMIPGALGVVSGLAQLIIYGVYNRSTKEQNEVTSAKAEMGFGSADVDFNGKNNQLP